MKITNFWKQQMAPSIDRFDIETLFWQINKYIFSITYLFWPNLTQFWPNLDRNSYYLLSNGFKHYMSLFSKIFLMFLVGYFERIGVSLIAALRAAAQPQFSQNNLPKTSKKSLKILTYNALLKVAMKKITLYRFEPAHYYLLGHCCIYWAKLEG